MKIKELRQEGFDIVVSAIEEECALEDCFDESEHDLDKMHRAIDSGGLVYFCAKIVVSRSAIELSTIRLGCCLHNTYDDFLNDDYLNSMVSKAIAEAKQNLKNLLKGLTVRL